MYTATTLSLNSDFKAILTTLTTNIKFVNKALPYQLQESKLDKIHKRTGAAFKNGNNTH